MKAVMLTRHPQTPSLAMTLPTWMGRTDSVLRVTYRIPGDTSEILMPGREPSEFRDELWKHTCFEAFVMPREGPNYVELNISPSTQWAAYQFDDYREGMRSASTSPAKIVSTSQKNRFELSVAFEFPEWVDVPWRVNLSAVVEEKDGRKSYWALAHPDGPPDFHNRDCFVAHLPSGKAP